MAEFGFRMKSRFMKSCVCVCAISLILWLQKTTQIPVLIFVDIILNFIK